MNDVLEFALKNLSDGKKVALISVISTTGSSPGTPGQMLAVSIDEKTKGTIGGGASEDKIIKKAKQAIENNELTFKFEIDHAENGMICGGKMEVFGNILGAQHGLCIFGGGHISQSLAKLAAITGFNVTVIEDREEFKEYFDSANYIVCSNENYENISALNLSDYIVICTRGHSTDDKALRFCLTKDYKYIGMIGSKTKVAELFSTLKKEGIKDSELDKIYAPIGLDIGSSAPSEIAAAILAEILLIKNNGELRHKKSQISL